MSIIYLIVPCYNCENQIESALNNIPRGALVKLKKIIVVNDGSTDNTAKILLRLKKILPLEVLTHKSNLGYGSALKTGIRYAIKKKGDIAITYHSDGQMDPNFIVKLIEEIKKGYSLSSGCRLLNHDLMSKKMPLIKIFGHYLVAWVFNLILKTKFYGYSDGFRAYDIKFLKTVNLDQLSNYFSFDAAIFIMAKVKNITWSQIPVPTNYSDAKSNLRIIRYGFDLVKLLVKYLKGDYS